jgi:hypothetical protein
MFPCRNFDTKVYVYEGVLRFQTQADKNVKDTRKNMDESAGINIPSFY